MIRPAQFPPLKLVQRLPHGEGRGQLLPQTGLLLYLARPNSDEYLVGEDVEIGEDTYIWGYHTGTDTDIRAATGWESGTANTFYDSAGDPIVALASEILADATINTANVLFKSTSVAQETGKLAIYDPATDADVIAKAKKVLKIT